MPYSVNKYHTILHCNNNDKNCTTTTTSTTNNTDNNNNNMLGVKEAFYSIKTDLNLDQLHLFLCVCVCFRKTVSLDEFQV